MIEASGLSKRYGDRLAVEGVSFRVEPGRVTGFLGPNGAGKSTTMRLMLGLDVPSAGRVTVNGRAYRELRAPLWEVGALLDARAVHGGRTARGHLGWLARSNRIPGSRVEEVLELVGLAGVAGRRVRGFSLGMSQRLGIAAALLGDPGVLIFDEPVNGLDTEGIAWIRGLLRRLAGEGRTVLVSSHLMSEMQLTADHLLVIGRGRLLADVAMRASSGTAPSRQRWCGRRSGSGCGRCWRPARPGSSATGRGGGGCSGWTRPPSATWPPGTASSCTSCPGSILPLRRPTYG
jgi:ABC-2 type transport system ATP-binding protein